MQMSSCKVLGREVWNPGLCISKHLSRRPGGAAWHGSQVWHSSLQQGRATVRSGRAQTVSLQATWFLLPRLNFASDDT